MTSEEKTYNMFRDVAIESGEDILIPANHAFKFIEACKKYRLAIQGFEGFETQDNGIMPRMDLIADFSVIQSKNWDELCEKSYDLTRSALASLQATGKLTFSFVLISQHE